MLFVARGSLLFCFSPACEPADNTQVSEAARLAQLDMDTVMSRESYEAAMYAAGKCKVLPRLQRTSTGGILNSACPFICLSFSHSYIIVVLSFILSFFCSRFSPSFPFPPSFPFSPLLSPSLPLSNSHLFQELPAGPWTASWRGSAKTRFAWCVHRATTRGLGGK